MFRRICMKSLKHNSTYIFPQIYANRQIFSRGGWGFFILFFLDIPTNPTISQILFLWCHNTLLYSTATKIYSRNISTKLSRVIPSPKSLAMSVIKNLSWLRWRKELAHWVKNCALLKKQFYKKWAAQKKANRLILQQKCPGGSNVG